MRNIFLSERTKQDIDKQVSKLLSDLGNPEPPLDLKVVRELLELDLQFYSTSDASALGEIIHSLKVAGKQIIRRPSILFEVIKKLDLKALLLPDKKRILIDQSQHEAKWRWSEAHEISHSIIPWHASLTLGDTDHTLAPHCHEKIEAEANYGAGQIVFLQGAFDKQSREMPPTIKTIQELKKRFGNSFTNTLWRYVEQSTDSLLGIIGPHPRYLPKGFDPENPCRYFIRSRRFAELFPNVAEREVFKILGAYCRWSKVGPIGSAEAVLLDLNGQSHIFRFESFSIRYETLTLCVHVGLRAPAVAVL